MKFFGWLYSLIFNTFVWSCPLIGLDEDSRPNESREKLAGFDYLDILHVWVKLMYSGENVIVLTEINAQAKDIEFWARIPKGQALEFLKDVVVLRCKDKSEMTHLVPGIGTKFANAYGFSDGELIMSNKVL